MKCIVQLRGLNASGKSTAMKQFVQKNGLKEKQIDVIGQKTWISVNEKIVVLGRYSREAPTGNGCDVAIRGKEHLIATIQMMMDAHFDVIAFEGVMYSSRKQLVFYLYDLAEKNGYKFISVLMHLDYTEELNRLFKRNGCKMINLDNFDSKRKSVYRIQNELRKSGKLTFEENVGKKPFSDMGEIVEKAIKMCE